MIKKILLVDDNLTIQKDLSRIIQTFGYACQTASNGKEGIDLLHRESFDAVLTDQNMAELDGFALLKAAPLIDPCLPVILFTGYGTIQMAVDAMKAGAFDYIQKPVIPEFLEVILKRAVEFHGLKKENSLLRSVQSDECELINVVGRSQVMRQVAKKVIKVAKSNVNVMIAGESGTGKELIARNIHYYSSRNDKPFIPVDCVSLPETLIESELFGFEKGAFTGAIKSRPGVFELAHGGTLFLDEITELDVQLQTKLLRVLQERHLRRIGGDQLIEVDVRIISATNRNPEKAVEEKKLRDDLYYRLNVVPIQLPPLRERKVDIPLLVRHFIKKYSAFSPIEFTEITSKAMRCLQNYPWPGNIRELENIIQRIVSLAEDPVIDLKFLPDEIIEMETPLDLIDLDLSYKASKKQYLQVFEKRYLEKLLEKYQGNLSQAANKAGMSRQTLYKLIEIHGLPFDT